MIDAAAATAAARQALLGLQGPAHAAVVRTVASGEAGPALKIDRLDAPGRGYYLVPWQDARGVVLLAQVDGASGALSSFAVLPMPQTQAVMSAEEARRRAVAQAPVAGALRLVWQPCRESASPLQPLYEVPVRSGVVFVAANGAVHDRLTPFARGG